MAVATSPTSASSPLPRRRTGSPAPYVGPMRDHSQVRGVYVYSAKDRMAGTTVSYAAAYPVGVPQTNANDTGLAIKTTSVDAFRADGSQLDPTALGHPNAFNGRATCCRARSQRSGSAIPRRFERSAAGR